MPNINYTRDIPDTPHDPSIDQPNMKTNSNSVDDILQVDHFSFNTANGGWHNQSTYPTRGAAAVSGNDPTTTSGQLALYSLTGSLGTQLWLVRDGISGTRVPLTSATVAAPVAAVNGYTWLPGNLLIQWGVKNAPSSSGSVTFPVAFTTVYNVSLTPRNDGSHSAFTYFLDGAPGNSSFNYQGSTSGSNSLYWIAIGLK